MHGIFCGFQSVCEHILVDVRVLCLLKKTNSVCVMSVLCSFDYALSFSYTHDDDTPSTLASSAMI